MSWLVPLQRQRATAAMRLLPLWAAAPHPVRPQLLRHAAKAAALPASHHQRHYLGPPHCCGALARAASWSGLPVRLAAALHPGRVPMRQKHRPGYAVQLGLGLFTARVRSDRSRRTSATQHNTAQHMHQCNARVGRNPSLWLCLRTCTPTKGRERGRFLFGPAPGRVRLHGQQQPVFVRRATEKCGG